MNTTSVSLNMIKVCTGALLLVPTITNAQWKQVGWRVRVRSTHGVEVRIDRDSTYTLKAGDELTFADTITQLADGHVMAIKRRSVLQRDEGIQVRYKKWVPYDPLTDDNSYAPDIVANKSAADKGQRYFTTDEDWDKVQAQLTSESPKGRKPIEWSRRAIIKQDDKDPSLLHVNFWKPQEKYDEAEYRIKLQNRRSITFRTFAWEMGAVTVPIKLRLGRDVGDIKIRQEAVPSANAGLYIGPSFGSIKYRNIKHQASAPIKFVGTVGLMGGVSVIELNKTNTKLATGADTLDTDKRVAALGSLALAGMVSMNDIRLGFFVGKDFTTAAYKRTWDFDSQIWIGFGVGLELSLFWAAKTN